MTRLRIVNSKNMDQIVGLTVENYQKNYIETNTESILEAYGALIEDSKAYPYGIYEGEVLIGFTMISYDKIHEEDPDLAKESYCIRSFMIDKNYQDKGWGREAFEEILDFIQGQPYGGADLVWLSYKADNEIAKEMYFDFGFEETKDLYYGENIAVKKLR